jgi:hypothetical protein
MANLYHVRSKEEYLGYDTYDSAVVCAESEEEAARIHPDGHTKFVDGHFRINGGRIWSEYLTWVKSPDEVTVTLIGTAHESISPGTVVCASFNAG